MDKLGQVLGRVERGETTRTDAAWLREQFAVHAIEKVAFGRHDRMPVDSGVLGIAPPDQERASSEETQVLVHQVLLDQGLADGYNDEQFAARLMAWILVEAVDLLQTACLPHTWFATVFGPRMTTAMGASEYAAALMGMVLGRHEAWVDAGLRVVDVAPATFRKRLVELCLPLLGVAHLLGVDLIRAVDEELDQLLAETLQAEPAGVDWAGVTVG